VVKIKNKKKLKWCLVNYDSGKITQKWAASYRCITPRRFRQLHTEYKTTGLVPVIGINLRKPKKEIPEEWIDIIKQEYDRFRLNALYMEKQYMYPIIAVITDHGLQFYANKRDKKGNADHGFETFLKEMGIKQILCGVNHSQTNGKQEIIHDFYKNHRARFNCLDELVEWYNNRPMDCLI